MLNYLKILRPKNLIIVAISQILIFWIYLIPLSTLSDMFTLHGNLWMYFVLDTVLIAAGGYVINDLMDAQTDAFNKPEKLYVGPDKINMTWGWLYYFLIVVFGFIIAYYIAYTIDKMHLLTIYPFAVGMLYLYSWSFKRLPLIGNLVVSIFCAFVPGIIWYAEFDLIDYYEFFPNTFYTMIMAIFPAYITFAFLSTFVREIIKDIEDLEGDMKSGYNTLPIAVGVDRAKVIALFFGLLLLMSYGLWFVESRIQINAILIFLIVTGMILPTLYILGLIRKARATADYSRISKYLKYLMVVSLFIFLCIPLILNI